LLLFFHAAELSGVATQFLRQLQTEIETKQENSINIVWKKAKLMKASRLTTLSSDMSAFVMNQKRSNC